MEYYSKKQRGDKGEERVAHYLQQKGYAIIAQKYHSRFGEIDIIAQKNKTLAFVEVKWRKKSDIDPTTAISYAKQQKIIATANQFIAHSCVDDLIYRFDVGIVYTQGMDEAIWYIPNAFISNE